MWVTGHMGQRAPSQGMRVKEERGSYGRVLGEDTEEVREVTEVMAERDESFGRKEKFPRFAGSFEARNMGVGDEGEDESCDVVREARN